MVPMRTSIPLSGLKGDNMVDPSPRTPWYHGPTLMEFLETTEIDEERLQAGPLRLPMCDPDEATGARIMAEVRSHPIDLAVTA